MKVLVVGCERHVFRLIEANLMRSYPGFELAWLTAVPELRSTIIHHEPSLIVAVSEDVATIASQIREELGLSFEVVQMKLTG